MSDQKTYYYRGWSEVDGPDAVKSAELDASMVDEKQPWEKVRIPTPTGVLYISRSDLYDDPVLLLLRLLADLFDLRSDYRDAVKQLNERCKAVDARVKAASRERSKRKAGE